jgi:hypothetical protein
MQRAKARWEVITLFPTARLANCDWPSVRCPSFAGVSRANRREPDYFLFADNTPGNRRLSTLAKAGIAVLVP